MNSPSRHFILPDSKIDDEAATILDFNQDNMELCRLVRRDTGKTLFEVQRSAKLAETSFHHAGDDQPFAVLEQHNMLPDKIIFNETGSSMQVRKWLKTPTLSSW
ncbi:hypothetical protein VKT23_018758 [Stygiomarasmius scandens]|uniref:Uncharacterized protein n=1 Tax=Marasmiellus scandens TaxID=2682957 RepID=A0ABR1ISK8_9AGAR